VRRLRLMAKIYSLFMAGILTG